MGRRQWQPTPVFLPGESQGRGSLVGCRLWGRTESDTTEATQQQLSIATMENSMEVPKNLNMELLYDPAISLLGIHLEKTINQKDTLVFITHTHTHTYI